MKSVTVDTNTILDALLKRDDRSVFQAYIEKATRGTLRVHIPYIVFFELEWVLNKIYNKDRDYCYGVLSALVNKRNIVTELQDLLRHAIELALFFPKISLADASIVISALMESGELITKDKELLAVWERINTPKATC